MTIAPYLGAPAFLTLALPSDDEAALVARMTARLEKFVKPNDDAEAYYEGSFVTTQFGISIPPSMVGLQTVAGWPGTTVDVLEERLDWLGWTSEGDDFGLAQVYADNHLDVESGMAHLDALIFGCSYVVVGTGYADEPEQLVTPHSPKSLTTLYDRRLRRDVAAYSIGPKGENGELPSDATLYKLGETVRLERQYGQWVVVDRDAHNLGRLPVVKMANRTRASREEGRSEITKAVRYYTDAACRTLLGLEVNREFYNSPQRGALNVSEEMFRDAAGNAVSQWTAIQGRVWAVPPNEDPDGPEPKIIQFPASSPAPYLDQIKGYAQLLGAEAGIPGAYLGFHTDNPASAEAIDAGETRLVKRSERRQTSFGWTWHEVGGLVLLMRDGEIPATYATTVTNDWRDPKTSSLPAAADATTKFVASGVLPADSRVTLSRAGLSPAEQRIVAADHARARATVITATPSGLILPAS